MEVVQRTGGDSPFGRRDVEEWSRLDELTGMLEHARVQTDQWAGIDAQGGSHKYGKKVVDARKTGEQGQHLQRQQLEVFQSKVAGGAMQMVKTQTASAWSHHGTRSTTGASTTVSSRTRWSSRSQQQQQTTGGSLEQPAITENFANLELAINPIDVSTLKMKASVGRSGAIGSRRPPSARSRRLSATKSGEAEKAAEESPPEEEETVAAPPPERAFTFEELKSNLKLGEVLGRRLSKSSSTDDLEVGGDSDGWRRGARVRRSLQFGTKEDGAAFAPVIATKRHSFVTVESLRDVRSRLKHFDPQDAAGRGILMDDLCTNSSSGLVRAALEQGAKLASAATGLGSGPGKTDGDSWRRAADVDANKTVVTLNESSQVRATQEYTVRKDGTLSPTKKRFNESFAFFRSGYSPDPQKPGSPRKTYPARQNMITIPIIFQQEASLKEAADKRRFSLRSGRDSETSADESESLGWVSRRQLDGLAPLKRRSWAGDSTLFGQHNNNNNEDRTVSLTFSSEHEETVHGLGGVHTKKNKRVEFCKTEVHFAAESGKFNIVETDEKPPPSNNFRRRRRSHPVANNAAADATPAPQVTQKPPLPELRFGDTVYEKEMLTATTEEQSEGVKIAILDAPPVELESPKTTSLTSIKRPPVEAPPEEKSTRSSSFSDSSSSTSLVRSTVTLKIQPPNSPKPTTPKSTLDAESGSMELQKLIKSLRPTSLHRRSLDAGHALALGEEEPLQFSVQDRIKLHEERKRGFSTKVNVGGTTVVRNTESIWLPGSRDVTAAAEPVSDEKKDVPESTFTKSPPQISPSKLVAPIAPAANPRGTNGTGPSITSISLSYESSQPKILASINSSGKRKESSETTKIVAPIPVKGTKPIKYSSETKIESKAPTCPRLEKASAFKSTESKFSSVKKEGSPVRLGDITSPGTRALSPSKRRTQSPAAPGGGGRRKPEFYFGAEVLEVEPRPADDRRRYEKTSDDEDEEPPKVGRKREPSPSKRLSSSGKDDLATGSKRGASKERTSTSALIEELTRAADEILQAVNGYDDSQVSSDDEKPRPLMPLPALKEGEIINEKTTKTTTTSRLRKPNIGRTPSTSSVDSVSHDTSTPRTMRTRKATTNGTRTTTSSTTKVSETTSSAARRTRLTRKRSDSLTSSKGDEDEADKARERLKMSKTRRSGTSSGQDTLSSSKSTKPVVKNDAVKIRAPVEKIIPPASRKTASKNRKDDVFHSNRVINGATAERRLQILESSCSGSGLRTDSSPGVKRHQHRTVRNAPLKVSAK